MFFILLPTIAIESLLSIIASISISHLLSTSVSLFKTAIYSPLELVTPILTAPAYPTFVFIPSNVLIHIICGFVKIALEVVIVLARLIYAIRNTIFLISPTQKTIIIQD